MKPVARIVIAGPSRESREKLSQLLTSSGYSPFRSCGSEGELRRALDMCEDGIVILTGLFPGLRPEELLWDHGQKTQILLIARPEQLSQIEEDGVFRLAVPTTGQAIVGAVEMLSQFHRMGLPKRAGSDRDIVNQAKRILMERQGITEPEAHRQLQQYAMNHGMKMADCAAGILKANGR